MSHSDARAEADLSFGLDSVEFGQDAARIWCQCGQDLTVTARKHEGKHSRLCIISNHVQLNYFRCEVLLT